MMNNVRVQRCRPVDIATAEASNKAKDRMGSFDLPGDEIVAEIGRARNNGKGKMLCSQDEVGNIVRIGCV